jgi:RNA polymerase sigma factor for flagellar operon FliA
VTIPAPLDADSAEIPAGPTPPPAATADVDTLIGEHLPLVGHIVRGVISRVPSHVHRDDLVSAGMLALVLAARSFDQSRGVPFSAFAALRIRGAVTDALRSLDWASRAVRSKARQVDTVRNDLAAALGRTPTRLEIAQAMGVAVSDLDAVEADVDRAAVLHLQALTPDSVEESLPTASDGPETLLIKREQIGYLHDAIAELPDRLRLVVQYYFFDNRKMADIADELGVTESRISQLRSEALILMRAAMTAANTDNSDPARDEPTTAPLRQRRYTAAVAARSTIADRLNATTLLGEPRPLLAVAS